MLIKMELKIQHWTLNKEIKRQHWTLNRFTFRKLIWFRNDQRQNVTVFFFLFFLIDLIDPSGLRGYFFIFLSVDWQRKQYKIIYIVLQINIFKQYFDYCGSKKFSVYRHFFDSIGEINEEIWHLFIHVIEA